VGWGLSAYEFHVVDLALEMRDTCTRSRRIRMFGLWHNASTFKHTHKVDESTLAPASSRLFPVTTAMPQFLTPHFSSDWRSRGFPSTNIKSNCERIILSLGDGGLDDRIMTGVFGLSLRYG